jgi:hypothetical protein
MVINGLNLPSIGFMRAKQLGGAGRYTLAVYPPGQGALAGVGRATMVELEVDEVELRRIIRVAPHLIAAPRCTVRGRSDRKRDTANRSVSGSPTAHFAKKTPEKAPKG